jgi:hypothetical protein
MNNCVHYYKILPYKLSPTNYILTVGTIFAMFSTDGK